MSRAASYILTNSKGTQVKLTNAGAAIMDIRFKDKHGKLQSLVAGFEDPGKYTEAQYQKKNFCLGATVGRVAGRISGGGFTLNGQFYPLTQNSGQHLHSEACGFQHQLWASEQPNDSTVKFSLKQADSSCGYPGNVQITATYELNEKNELVLTYTGTTDKATVLNLCNHSYFNLNGAGSISDHYLTLAADRVLQTNEKIIPNGIFLNVEDVNLDFRKQIQLQERLGKGLDHAFELATKAPIELFSASTGISLTIETNQSAVVVYTPKSFDDLELSNKAYTDYPAICLELQALPDAPNHKNFPSIRLDPGEEYKSCTIYAFKVE